MIPEEIFEKVWDILVEHAGASRDPLDKVYFVQAHLSRPLCTEFRFCGTLGFGGKFRRYDGDLYVTCYPEDETPERRATIEKVNGLLRELPSTSLRSRRGF